ncbi:GNAT family N-acetyltransferase [Paenibacillus sp. Z6-24]
MGSSIQIRPLQLAHAEALLQMRIANRESMSVYDPVRPECYWTLEVQQQIIIDGQQSMEAGSGYIFGIFEQESDTLVGRIELSGIARGPFQNGYVGYFVDQHYHGRGYGTEALRQCTAFGFEEGQLHRIQAGVLPWNIPSQRVLEKVGFRKEGLAERYLHINGKWEDHLLYAMTVEEWHPSV